MAAHGTCASVHMCTSMVMVWYESVLCGVLLVVFGHIFGMCSCDVEGACLVL